MNYQTSFEGLRQNAASGPVWLCSQKQAGTVAGLLDKMIGETLEHKAGATFGQAWIRDNVRLPFLNWLFENATYAGEYYTHKRANPIASANDLTAGEAHAILQWLGLDTAEDDLWGWIEVQDIPHSERLI